MNAAANPARPDDDARPRAAVLTPEGRGAVAVIRVVGPGSAAMVGRHFEPASGRPWQADTPGRISLGRFRTTPEAEPAEELVITARGPDDVEIHGHGGRAAVEAILEALAADGCRIVDWREMVVARTADRIAAEATIALAEARTVRTAAVLVDQQAGALRRAIDAIAGRLDVGDAAAAGAMIDELLRFVALGRRLTEPFRVTLAGRPNVGKSSLLNALVGYARAIVFDQPGTTRDVVTAVTALDGLPVELADTAGRRAATDALEAAGIERAERRSEADDLVVLVCDASEAWTAADEALAAKLPDALVVHNKCDLAAAADAGRPPGLAVSAIAGTGLAELQAAIVGRLVPEPPEPGQAVPFTARQVEALVVVRAALAKGDLSGAAAELGRI